MRRDFSVILIFLLLSLSLTGCWSSRELNELAIIVAAGLDKSDDEVLLSLQVISPGEISPQRSAAGRAPIVTYRGTGKTVLEAVREMTKKIPRRSYWSHLRIVVIGEELAKEDGVTKVLDFLARDHEIRGDFYIVLSHGVRAEEVLGVMTPIDKIPAQKMFASLKTSAESWGSTQAVYLSDLISDLASTEKGATLSGIHFRGDLSTGEKRENVERSDPAAIVEYVGLGVLKKGKLIGWLNQEESKGITFAKDQMKSTIISAPCPKQGEMAMEVIRARATVDVQLKEGKLSGKIHVYADGSIAETDCAIDLTKLPVIHQIEKKMEKRVIGIIESSIQAAKELQTDVIGFSDKTHKKYPKYFKQVKEDWDEIFAKMNVEVTADVHLRRTGTEVNPFLQEMGGS